MHTESNSEPSLQQYMRFIVYLGEISFEVSSSLLQVGLLLRNQDDITL